METETFKHDRHMLQAFHRTNQRFFMLALEGCDDDDEDDDSFTERSPNMTTETVDDQTPTSAYDNIIRNPVDAQDHSVSTKVNGDFTNLITESLINPADGYVSTDPFFNNHPTISSEDALPWESLTTTGFGFTFPQMLVYVCYQNSHHLLTSHFNEDSAIERIFGPLDAQKRAHLASRLYDVIHDIDHTPLLLEYRANIISSQRIGTHNFSTRVIGPALQPARTDLQEFLDAQGVLLFLRERNIYPHLSVFSAQNPGLDETGSSGYFTTTNLQFNMNSFIKCMELLCYSFLLS